MSHEITERADGTAETFQTLVPAWHGLGVTVAEAPNSADAIKLAGLDWTVSKVDAFARTVKTVDQVDHYQFHKADDYRAIIRDDNGRVLGFVTDKYVPVQNVQAFDFLDGLKQDGIVKYETAGSLRGGKAVWVLAKTDSIIEVAPGDRVQPYILFSTTHDGTGSIRILPTTVRVVCNNTLTVALGRHGTGITLRHDGTVTERLKAVTEIVRHATGKISLKLADAAKLVQRKLDKSEFAKFVDDLLPLDPESARPQLRLKAREQLAWNFYSNPRQNLPGIERSAWAAYNALSELTDHQSRFRSIESRFNSIVEGTANALKQKAFDNLVALV